MRRKWITILRIFRYGLNNFARNAWLSTAATVVMTVTLTIILATFTLRLVFSDTLATISQKIDISVYLADNISDQEKTELTSAIKAIKGVGIIDNISKDQARQDYIEQNKGDTQQIEALNVLGDTNPFPASLRVHVGDTSRINEVITDVSKLVGQEKYKPYQSKPASTNGSRKEAIENIARVARFSELAGLAVSGLFLVLSIMVIFNTIRMAIFNRRDEIEIMKLIGAEKSFIRGPFVVEACFYGIFAAIIAVALLYVVMLSVGSNLANYGITVAPALAFFAKYPLLIFVGELLAGIVIGILSSLLAIRRYLKI